MCECRYSSGSLIHYLLMGQPWSPRSCFKTEFVTHVFELSGLQQLVDFTLLGLSIISGEDSLARGNIEWRPYRLAGDRRAPAIMLKLDGISSGQVFALLRQRRQTWIGKKH